jgi:DNA topoisomerase VI subunit B
MNTRTPFTTSRLLEFTSVEELTKLVGFPAELWPVVFVKETIDNALDAAEEAEEAQIEPQIDIAVSTEKSTISVEDNGPGIRADTVTRLLDYTKKTSSREAYVGPTRGAQGNALQTLLAMPFALDRSRGETIINSQGTEHRIVFTIDTVRREPKIEHVQRRSLVQNATCITTHWPNSASLQLVESKWRIVQIARGFAWLNPHASITVKWDNEVLFQAEATDPDWHKWRPSDPDPAHWYDSESFNRLIAAYIADDEDHGRDRMVREFISEFRGFTRSDMQKTVLDEVDAARISLRDFAKQPRRVDDLLACLQYQTKPVAAKDFGQLGREHFQLRFAALGTVMSTFNYKRALLDLDDVPYVIEVAFGYAPNAIAGRYQIVGVNWSPSMINPYRRLGDGEGLEDLLYDQRVRADERIVLALHIASPRIAYTDKAKSALLLPDKVASAFSNAVRSVTKRWAKIRKAEERNAAREDRRLALLTNERKEKVNAVAFELMPEAYRAVSGPKNLWANPRQMMYNARPEILHRTGKDKFDDAYFTQQLLPNFINANPKLTAKWKIAYDDRGHFADPHTGLMIGLGTVAVRAYVEKLRNLEIKQAAIASAYVKTYGPHGSYGAVLYIEKEGFLNLLDEVKLAQRFDLAIMSCKGLSVTAARELADEVCHLWRVPLFILHDFDKAGFSIRAGFLKRQTRRYTFKNQIPVYDLGLRMEDVRHLIDAGKDEPAAKERGSADKRFANMRGNGATVEEARYLLNRRVELNAFTSDEFVALIERKLSEHEVKKIIPPKAVLAETYRTLVQGRDIEKVLKRELRKLQGGPKVSVPADLLEQVRRYLAEHPEQRWDAAVTAVAKKAQ